MQRRRPGLVTTFAILNLLFAGLLLTCGIAGLTSYYGKVEWTEGGRMVDKTQFSQDFMKREVPGYAAYPIGNLAIRVLLAVALGASGVGLLFLQPWARFVALGSGALLAVYRLLETIYIIVWVNPATAKLVDLSPFRVGGAVNVLATVGTVMFTIVFLIFSLSLVFAMLAGSTARAFSGEAPVDEDMEDDRARRRPRDEYEDEDEPPRRPQRRPRPAEDVEEPPPPRRPLRPRPRNEDED